MDDAWEQAPDQHLIARGDEDYPELLSQFHLTLWRWIGMDSD